MFHVRAEEVLQFQEIGVESTLCGYCLTQTVRLQLTSVAVQGTNASGAPRWSRLFKSALQLRRHLEHRWETFHGMQSHIIVHHTLVSSCIKKLFLLVL